MLLQIQASIVFVSGTICRNNPRNFEPLIMKIAERTYVAPVVKTVEISVQAINMVFAEKEADQLPTRSH